MPPISCKLDPFSVQNAKSSPDVTAHTSSDVTSSTISSDVTSRGNPAHQQQKSESAEGGTMTSQHVSDTSFRPDKEGPSSRSPVPSGCLGDLRMTLPRSSEEAEDFRDEEDLSAAKTFMAFQNSQSEEGFRPRGISGGLRNGECVPDVMPSQRNISPSAHRRPRATEEPGSLQDRSSRQSSHRQRRTPAPKSQLYQFTAVHPPGPGSRVKAEPAGKNQPVQLTSINPPGPGSKVKVEHSGKKQTVRFSSTNPPGPGSKVKVEHSGKNQPPQLPSNHPPGSGSGSGSNVKVEHSGKIQLYQFTAVHPPGPGPKVKAGCDGNPLLQFTSIHPHGQRSKVKPGHADPIKSKNHKLTLKDFPHLPGQLKSAEVGWKKNCFSSPSSPSSDSEDSSFSGSEDGRDLVQDDEDAESCWRSAGSDRKKRRRGRGGRGGGQGRVLTPCCHELIITALLLFLALGVLLLRYLLLPPQKD